MKDMWTTKDLMYYYKKSSSEIKRWRNEGLKSTKLTTGYTYKYSDIVAFLMEA